MYVLFICVHLCVNYFNRESNLIDHFREIIFSLAHFVWTEPFYLNPLELSFKDICQRAEMTINMEPN